MRYGMRYGNKTVLKTGKNNFKIIPDLDGPEILEITKTTGWIKSVNSSSDRVKGACFTIPSPISPPLSLGKMAYLTTYLSGPPKRGIIKVIVNGCLDERDNLMVARNVAIFRFLQHPSTVVWREFLEGEQMIYDKEEISYGKNF